MDDSQNSIPQQPTLTKKQRKELHRQEKLREREQVTTQYSRKRILLWSITILGTAAIVVGLAILARITNNVPTGNLEPVSDNDWSKGSKTAPATLVEYSDFQCPACATFYPIIKQAQQDLGEDKLRIVYRPFPLTSIHPNAQIAAAAAEAAGKQGKFWEMHDILYERQTAWENNSKPTDIFTQYAEELKLDKNKFTTDIASQDVLNRIEHGITSGNNALVNATPSFFLNGQRLPSFNNYDEFKNYLQQAANSTGTPQ